MRLWAKPVWKSESLSGKVLCIAKKCIGMFGLCTFKGVLNFRGTIRAHETRGKPNAGFSEKAVVAPGSHNISKHGDCYIFQGDPCA